MTLTVERDTKDGKMGLYVSWDEGHPQSHLIEELLDKKMGPGYVEYLIENNTIPKCSFCNHPNCEKTSSSDEACGAFMIGRDW